MNELEYTVEQRLIEVNGKKQELPVKVFKTLDKILGAEYTCQIKGNGLGHGGYWSKV